MRIPALAELGTQTTALTRDSLMTNFLPEKREGEWEAVKRNGTANGSVVDPDLAGYGTYYWQSDAKFYTAAGTKLYRDGTDLSVTAPGNRVGFCEAGVVTKYLFVDSKTTAWYVATGGAITAISDPVYTGTIAASPGTVGTPIEMDGYVFVARADGRIYHSDNVDETASNIDVWDPDNYIAVTESDTLHAIIKHNAFIAAIGDKAVEFFYDAGNEEGSVLAPVQASVIRYGAPGASSIAQVGDIIFYVASMSSGGYTVVMIEDMKPKNIGTPSVMRILGAGTGHQSMVGMATQIGGHHLYALTVGSTTIAYHIPSQQWVRLDPWPWVATTSKNGDTYLQHGTRGTLCAVSEDWQDYNPVTASSTAITATIRSPAMEFGTPKAKRMNGVGLESNAVGTGFTARYSDDDFSTWSTARTFPTTTPWLYNLGRFKRRSVEITHAANEQARLKAVHLDVG